MGCHVPKKPNMSARKLTHGDEGRPTMEAGAGMSASSLPAYVALCCGAQRCASTSYVASWELGGRSGVTHGKQLGERHHRRNRPCTYRSCHRCQYSVVCCRLLLPLPPLACFPPIADASSWRRAGGWAILPIVNDQSCDFFCIFQSSQRFVLIIDRQWLLRR